METTSTHDLLLLHAYGETTLEQREFLATELLLNDSLQDELFEIIQTQQQLNSLQRSPSETSLRIIMEQSCNSAQLQEA